MIAANNGAHALTCKSKPCRSNNEATCCLFFIVLIACLVFARMISRVEDKIDKIQQTIAPASSAR